MYIHIVYINLVFITFRINVQYNTQRIRISSEYTEYRVGVLTWMIKSKDTVPKVEKEEDKVQVNRSVVVLISTYLH